MNGFWRGFWKFLNAELEPADAIRIPFLVLALVLLSVPASVHRWKQKRAERARRQLEVADLAVYRGEMEPKTGESP
ncbi:MAG: hypothetical protein HYT39_00220 [Candidatus Sungbacteria bacterium]|nr:hypothetical protein [Candidatus Sungbacteria bacterium]